jgi:SAM-dependent methyltransferase
MPSSVDTLESERRFHNEVFVSHSRASVRGFYQAGGHVYDHYRRALVAAGNNLDVLEIGIGAYSPAGLLAQTCGDRVTGVDISDVAVEMATSRKIPNARFICMNAEELQFPANSFDLVFGSSILHHLDLEAAYSGIARVLRPQGQAIFIEPLGHNPFINWFRKRTPKMRTPDEHPLLMRDIELAGKYFNQVSADYFNLCSIAAKWWKPLRGPLELVDRQLLRVPFIRKYAWMCILQVAQRTVCGRAFRAESVF